MINSGNISFISGTILKPYQMAIVQNLYKTSLTWNINQVDIPSLALATETFTKNVS